MKKIRKFAETALLSFAVCFGSSCRTIVINRIPDEYIRQMSEIEKRQETAKQLEQDRIKSYEKLERKFDEYKERTELGFEEFNSNMSTYNLALTNLSILFNSMHDKYELLSKQIPDMELKMSELEKRIGTCETSIESQDDGGFLRFSTEPQDDNDMFLGFKTSH